jgi:hypothetical protein
MHFLSVAAYGQSCVGMVSYPVAAGPVPDYLSPGGSYCTMSGGGQVWVPGGVSPSDVGCWRLSRPDRLPHARLPPRR